MAAELLSPSTHILLVDDEPSIVESVSRYLGREGYRASTATNGEEALLQIRRETPDVIVLDVKMPHLDGLAVCKKLRADFRTRGLPIILIAGNGTTEDRLQGYKTGADDFLAKPFDLDELKVRIQGALERRHWDQGTHPLTHLPGSPGIEEEVRRRMLQGSPFAFAYLDIDSFKAYNDAYGYDAGDRVIKQLGESLKDASAEPGSAYPGHIGGDDFVLITTPEIMRDRLPKIVDRFDRERMEHYKPEDRAAGKISCKSRRGDVQEFPLMALTVAVVSSETRRIQHYARMAEIASELKHFIKSQPHHGKSLVIWDRRTDVYLPEEKTGV